jgi:hypothetical protein
MNITDKTEKEITYEVTQKDWEEGIAKGWTEDDMLPVGKHEFRRATRFRNKPEEVNVKLELPKLMNAETETVRNQTL